MGPALRIRAALVDVGGTLWPNSWPHRVSDAEGRLARLHAALPHLRLDAADVIVRDIIDSSRDLNGGTTMVTELIRVEANVLVHDCLERHGVEPLPATVSAVRRAMRLPIEDRIFLLPGAIDLLKAIKDRGLRCVIASNTYWRDALDYAEDFAKQGLAPYVDAIVTSVDAGHLKPHRAVFDLAISAAGVSPDECVVIGNSEKNDVEPAIALGMRSILVHPDDPPPIATRADAVAPDLWACADALRAMLGRSA